MERSKYEVILNYKVSKEVTAADEASAVNAAAKKLEEAIGKDNIQRWWWDNVKMKEEK